MLTNSHHGDFMSLQMSVASNIAHAVYTQNTSLNKVLFTQ